MSLVVTLSQLFQRQMRSDFWVIDTDNASTTRLVLRFAIHKCCSKRATTSWRAKNLSMECGAATLRRSTETLSEMPQSTLDPTKNYFTIAYSEKQVV